jgi:hypothetical protein
MRRKLNTLKMVADISWPHNIQDYCQPIEQHPITKRVLIKVTTAMFAYKVRLDVQRMSEKFQYRYTYLLTILCLFWWLCNSKFASKQLSKQMLHHNLPHLTRAVQNDQSTFNSSHSQHYRHAENVVFELPASTIHYFFIVQLLSFLLPTTNIYDTAVQTSLC